LPGDAAREAAAASSRRPGAGALARRAFETFRPRARVALAVLSAAALAVAALVYVRSLGRESTDDAFIEGHIVQVSPQVAGHVARVLVDDNELVEEGRPIVEIDPRDFEARLAEAQAQLDAARAALERERAAAGTARARVATAESQLDQARAQLVAATATAEEARAELIAADADATRADADAKRYLHAIRSQGVSRLEVDRAEAEARAAEARFLATRRRVAASEAQVVEAEAAGKSAEAGVRAAQSQLEEAEARTVVAGADVERADAARKGAALDLSYTRIFAPARGRVGRKAVEPGNYVVAGQVLLALVLEDVWVVANFKETQLAHMRPGQPAIVHVDAAPGHDLRAHVDSIQPGTGARFSLLPPENATGNYVKVVQRVPVKIVFDEQPEVGVLLFPGLSVQPEVRVK
jgi:membrane fusion protein (multidrug efflux system)